MSPNDRSVSNMICVRQFLTSTLSTLLLREYEWFYQSIVHIQFTPARQTMLASCDFHVTRNKATIRSLQSAQAEIHRPGPIRSVSGPARFSTFYVLSFICRYDDNVHARFRSSGHSGRCYFIGCLLVSDWMN